MCATARRERPERGKWAAMRSREKLTTLLTTAPRLISVDRRLAVDEECAVVRHVEQGAIVVVAAGTAVGISQKSEVFAFARELVHSLTAPPFAMLVPLSAPCPWVFPPVKVLVGRVVALI